MKKHKMIFSGCSMTYGAESMDTGVQISKDNFNNSYPLLLSKKLKNIEVINLAQCGISNSTIFCHTINYLFENIDNKENLIFVIQWSWPERWPTFEKLKSDPGSRMIRDGWWIDEANHNLEDWGDDNELAYGVCENLTYCYIVGLMKLLDSMNIKHIQYMATRLKGHVPRSWEKILGIKPRTTSPIFLQYGRVDPITEDYIKSAHVNYDLNTLQDTILNHESFVMDNWAIYMMENSSIERQKLLSHPDAAAHQVWANELLKILLNKQILTDEFEWFK